jgi:hypothetical protein
MQGRLGQGAGCHGLVGVVLLLFLSTALAVITRKICSASTSHEFAIRRDNTSIATHDSNVIDDSNNEIDSSSYILLLSLLLRFLLLSFFVAATSVKLNYHFEMPKLSVLLRKLPLFALRQFVRDLSTSVNAPHLFNAINE